MNTIGKNIKKLRTSRGMTQQQLADVVGAKTYTTITKWEKGDNVPQGKDLIVLSKTFGVTVDSILGIEEELIIKEPTAPYDYFSTALVSAGQPFYVDGITEDDVEQIEIPDSVLGKWAGDDIFITKVNGDSMNKVIPDKSLIAVKPIELHQLKDGDIVVYSNDGGDFSVKRYYLNDEEIVFRPDSHDSSFFEQRYKTTENIMIHGKVVVYIVELD